jgi:hypothetical protein
MHSKYWQKVIVGALIIETTLTTLILMHSFYSCARFPKDFYLEVLTGKSVTTRELNEVTSDITSRTDK